MFVIVRHGNTFAAGEPPRRIGARTDLPLTPAGVAQGEALGAYFASAGWRFARVLVSPLERTRRTAEAILNHQDHPPAPIACDWLREIDHGPDENRTEDEVLARIGAEALAAWDERAQPPPDWIVDAEKRHAAWRDLFASDPGPTLVVTSNGAARFALSADLALVAARSELPNLKLPTGSYGVIRKNSEGTLEVPVWGLRP
jgi:probable phosphoglycerate mutase